jgi:hypothetical protein
VSFQVSRLEQGSCLVVGSSLAAGWRVEVIVVVVIGVERCCCIHMLGSFLEQYHMAWALRRHHRGPRAQLVPTCMFARQQVVESAVAEIRDCILAYIPGEEMGCMGRRAGASRAGVVSLLLSCPCVS